MCFISQTKKKEREKNAIQEKKEGLKVKGEEKHSRALKTGFHLPACQWVGFRGSLKKMSLGRRRKKEQKQKLRGKRCKPP